MTADKEGPCHLRAQLQVPRKKKHPFHITQPRPPALFDGEEVTENVIEISFCLSILLQLTSFRKFGHCYFDCRSLGTSWETNMSNSNLSNYCLISQLRCADIFLQNSLQLFTVWKVSSGEQSWLGLGEIE